MRAQQDLVASLNHCCVCTVTPRDFITSWVLKGGLWCRVRDLVSLDSSDSSALPVSQGLAEGFGVPSPGLFCRDTASSGVAMTTLERAQNTLIARNLKALLKSHVAHCKQMAQNNELALPGDSPATVGGKRADVVVTLDEKRALEEYQVWLRARKGILPLSLGMMAMAIEKERRPRRGDSELVNTMMQEGERWVLCLGIYVNTLPTQAERLQEEGRVQSRPLSALLSSFARQRETFQRLLDGGLEQEADFVTLLVDKAWWCRWCGDASAIRECSRCF